MGRVSAVSSRAVGPDGAPLPPKEAVDAAAQFLVLRPVASEVADKFCARPRVPGRGAMQTANALLDAYVCNAGIDAPSPPRTAQMRVSLLKDGTGCDEAGERYLACGFRDSSVEISFAQARYSFLDPLSGSRIWVGKVGRREFDGLHVLIHEVGHWFGLSHTDLPIAAQINDIMQPALDTPTCASELSMWLINNMSDQNYQNRFRGAEKQGLKAPRP